MRFEILKQPYPFRYEKGEVIRSGLFFGGFVFAFLLFFRSENFGAISLSTRILYSFYFFIIVSAGMILNGFINIYTSSIQTQRTWKVENEIKVYLIHVFTIAISVFFLSDRLELMDLSFVNYCYSVLATVLVGIIPLAIYILLRHNTLLKKHLQDVQAINSQIIINPSSLKSKSAIEIGKHKVEVNNILYVESEKNYVLVSTTQKEIKTRSTIKKMQELLKPYRELIRCHRAFIINVSHVTKVEGNAQGLKLFFDDSSTFIPVSRNYIGDIKSALAS